MAEHAAERDAQTCAHVHVEAWRKFGGTMLWRCLDCGADCRDDPTVIPLGSARPDRRRGPVTAPEPTLPLEHVGELAEALHRERCDGGHKEWAGCRDPLGRGCEDIVERALAPLIAGWLAEDTASARHAAKESALSGMREGRRLDALRARVEALADEWERGAAWIRSNGYAESVEDPATLTEAAARRLRTALAEPEDRR